MTCPVCGSDYLTLDICMDDGIEWEAWACLVCHHTWEENFRDFNYLWEGEE